MTTDPFDKNLSSGPSGLGPSVDDKNWAVAAHLSGFLAAYVALGVLGPLAIYFIKGNQSSFVREHSVEAINFNITVLIGIAISVVLTIIAIGFLMLIAIGLAYVIFTIKAAMAAREGQVYLYPFTLRLLK